MKQIALLFLYMVLNLGCSSKNEKLPQNDFYFDYLSDYPNLSRKIFFNLDDALSHSQKNKKELLILFTSFGLHSNFRNNIPEWRMLCNENIKQKIEKDYVLCLLFVDNHEEINDKNYQSNFTKSHFETYGEMWFEIEIEKFNRNVCPLFVKMNSKKILIYEGSFKDYSSILEFIK
jgi:hypothetical protein